MEKYRALCEEGLAAARRAGASYADMRVVRLRRQTIESEDVRIARIADTDEIGFGIRAIVDGRWGFASGVDLTSDEAGRVAERACKIARASALAPAAKRIELLDEPPLHMSFATPVQTDPWTVSVDRKCGLLVGINEALLKVKGVTKATGYLYFKRDERALARSDGSFATSDVTTSAASYEATATGDGVAKTRSYEPPIRTAGYENIDEEAMRREAVRVGEQAVEHLRAPESPVGAFALVLDPLHLALTMHESVGHPTELDRVLGMEESLAGRSFATPEKLGNYRYGSPLVNFVADNTLPAGLATHGFDDDGVPGQRWHIVEEGILKGYTTSREVGGAVGDKRSRGSCRADSFASIPIVRIPNLSLMPGAGPLSPDELIADTDDGIYIEGMGSFSIDQMRLNFQFGGNAFWRIRHGKKVHMLKDVTYQAITPKFWGSCDAICDRRFWVPNGVISCGKGDPMQISQMTHGAATARFRRIDVGGALKAMKGSKA